MGFLLRYENVAWYENGRVRILDRRIYPVGVEFVVCESYVDVAAAIGDMVTQSGGPPTAAGMGMALAAYEGRDLGERDFLAHMEGAAYALAHARPTTAANMAVITARSLGVAKAALEAGESGAAIADLIFEDVIDRLNAHYARYESIGRHLCGLIPKNGIVMTQCYGETVLGMLLRADRARGGGLRFICPETRPYYQGARLTASLIHDMGYDATVITDNMPAHIMARRGVDIFTSAADIICMDGHIINKIGTFQIALAAKYHEIPYFATGTPNRHHPTISTTHIEERDPALVLESMGRPHTLPGVKGYYPAFDTTPPALCAGIVTDKGVFQTNELDKYYS